MKFPIYWAKARAEASDARGREVSFTCWRSSQQSQPAAQESALAAARRIVQNLVAGKPLEHYGYGERPAREEVLETMHDARGELCAAVTRNLYGSLVLNTSQAMFIDLDFPPVGPGERLRHLAGKLFGKSAGSPETERTAEAMRKLERLSETAPEWSGRVYRTFGGLRVLATHALFDPLAESTRQLLESVESDPLYVKLCRGQECFRARLTPKPWRCDIHEKVSAWPRESEPEQTQFAEWLAAYDDRQTEFATCRYLGPLGAGVVLPEIEPIVALHDRMTRCGEKLPLA